MTTSIQTDPSASIEELIRRDYEGAARTISRFVRQDRHRARYLGRIAFSLRLTSDTKQYRQHATSLKRLQQDLDGLRESIARADIGSLQAAWGDFDAELEGIVYRHRVTAHALWTACDFFGLQLPANAGYLEKSLRRSIEVAQEMVKIYARLVPKVAERLLGATGLLSEPIVIVSFDHQCDAQVDFSLSTDGSKHLCMFVELPYWYAVRHRHLPALAHEISYAWLEAVSRQTDIVSRLAEFLDDVAVNVAGVLAQHIEEVVRADSSGLEQATADELHATGHAYACKVLADLLAYSIAGPSYLYSFLFSEAAGVFASDPTIVSDHVPVASRLGCLLQLSSLDLEREDKPPWDVFRRMNALARSRLDLRGTERAYERDLVEAFAPLIQTVSRTVASAWRDPASAEQRASEYPRIREYAWEEVMALPHGAYPLAKWRHYFEDAGWHAPAIPSFLWGQYVDDPGSDKPRRSRMGSLAHPLWEAVLRPDSENRITRRGDYLDLTFYRLAPSTDESGFLKSLQQNIPQRDTDPNPFVSGVLGAWDFMSIRPLTRAPASPEVFDRVYYFDESHFAAEILFDGTGGGDWAQRLSTPQSTLVVSQFVLGDDVSTAGFVDSVVSVTKALQDPGVSVALVLTSLGWEDAIVIWRVAPGAKPGAISRAVLELFQSSADGDGPVRHSFTQVLVGPRVWRKGADPLAGSDEVQPANLSATLEIELSGVLKVKDLVGRIERDKLGEVRSRTAVPWGHVDVVIQLSIEPTTDLLALRRRINALVADGLAVSATCSWLHPPAAE